MQRAYTLEVRRYLLFLPSLFFGMIGGLWLYFKPFPYTLQLPVWGLLMVAFLLVAGLLGAAWLLEKYLPSFSYASKLLERALGRVRISLVLAFLLAAASSVAEELFFRGALLPLIGVWGQALLFGLMHPAPRRAWSYTVFTFLAGLAFGYATLLSGSLWPALIAHFTVNLQGFLEIRQQQKRRTRYTNVGGLGSPRVVNARNLVAPATSELVSTEEAELTPEGTSEEVQASAADGILSS